MPIKYANRVKETTTTTGTSTFSLLGPVQGFQGFVAGIGDTYSCYYCAYDNTDWEVGIGTVTDNSPDTLSRDTILESSNSGSKVNFAAGVKVVICTYPAPDNTFLHSDEQSSHFHNLIGHSESFLYFSEDSAGIGNIKSTTHSTKGAINIGSYLLYIDEYNRRVGVKAYPVEYDFEAKSTIGIGGSSSGHTVLSVTSSGDALFSLGTQANAQPNITTTVHTTKGTLNIGSTLYVDEANIRVGINNSSPSSVLDLKGTLTISGSTSGSSTLAVSSTGTATLTLASAASATPMISSTSNGTKGTINLGSTLYVDEVNNRIGISNTSPTYKLDVLTTARVGSLIFGSLRSDTISRDVNSSLVSIVGGTDHFIGTGSLTDKDGGFVLSGSNRTSNKGLVQIHAGNITSPTDNDGYILFYTGGNVPSMSLDRSKSLTIGAQGTNNSGTNVLSIINGSAPSSSPTDTIQIYSADAAAGNAALHLRTENGNIIKLYRVATYTPSNFSTSRSFNAGTVSTANLANAVATLITDLQTLGILG